MNLKFNNLSSTKNYFGMYLKDFDGKNKRNFYSIYF